MSIIDLLAYIAGCLVLLSYLPQLYKSYKAKRVEDLSLAMFCLALVGNGLYLVYALMLQLTPLIFSWPSRLKR